MKPVGIVLCLVGIGWLAAILPGTSPADPAYDRGWRRTSVGWESCWSWDQDQRPREPAPHPSVAISLQVLLGLLAANLRVAGKGRSRGVRHRTLTRLRQPRRAACQHRRVRRARQIRNLATACTKSGAVCH